MSFPVVDRIQRACAYKTVAPTHCSYYDFMEFCFSSYISIQFTSDLAKFDFL
jgi:hypothetical protein